MNRLPLPELDAATLVGRYQAIADIERGLRVLESEIEIAPVCRRPTKTPCSAEIGTPTRDQSVAFAEPSVEPRWSESLIDAALAAGLLLYHPDKNVEHTG